jgi:pimeloyl-ACP methyl ester carboxylesterase
MLNHPSRVNRAVLLGPALPGYPPSKQYQEWLKSMQAAMPDASAMLEAMLSSDAYAVHRVLAGPQSELVRRVHAENLERSLASGNQHRQQQPPAFERLTEIDIPILLILGTEDSADVKTFANQYKTSVRHLVVHEIEGGDHFVMLERPDLVAREIKEFFSPGNTGPGSS